MTKEEAMNDPLAFDVTLAEKLVNYMTGPYKREITVVCEGCGSIGTMIEEMPDGYMRLGIPHALCPECLRIISERRGIVARDEKEG